MVQSDREGGNQSGLREAFSSYNHSLNFEKRSSICSHTQTIMLMFQGEGGQTESYNKEEELEHGVDRDLPKCSHSLF